MSKWLLLQLSWIRDYGGMEQDCGNWYGKKKIDQRMTGKAELTGFNSVTSQMGGKDYAQISEPGN